jgi:DNA invertase Pin-like site-specific DNA recombinase
MTTAYYLRVSTSSQDTKSQEADLKGHAANESNAAFYRDRFTGKAMDRPGWNRLWADVLAGMVRRIVVWRLDRLGRTVSGLSRLFEGLQQRRVGLVSLRDGLDLQTAAGRLMAHVLASVAAYELEVKTERQRAGIEAARAEHGGRCPWGGRKPGTRVKVTEEVESVIRQRSAVGDSVASIARVCGLSRVTVYAVLGRGGSGGLDPCAICLLRHSAQPTRPRASSSSRVEGSGTAAPVGVGTSRLSRPLDA